jgi:hypothetical protein
MRALLDERTIGLCRRTVPPLRRRSAREEGRRLGQQPRAVRLRLSAHGLEVITAAMRIVRDREEQQLAPLGGRASARSIALQAVLQTLLADTEQFDDRPTPD